MEGRMEGARVSRVEDVKEGGEERRWDARKERWMEEWRDEGMEGGRERSIDLLSK